MRDTLRRFLVFKDFPLSETVDLKMYTVLKYYFDSYFKITLYAITIISF